MKKLNLKTIGAISAVSMIALSVLGMRAASAFAQSQTPPAAVATAEDVSTGPDTDTIDEQVGDQTAADGVVDTAETTGAEVKTNDTDNLNVEEQVGDQTGVDSASAAAEAGN